MIRFLILSLLTLIGNAIGLIVAAIAVPGFHLDPFGFVISALFFTVVEIFFKPFIMKMSLKYMPALGGGTALVTTFVGLWLTSIFTNGLRLEGLSAWIVAPLVIWLAAVLAGVVLPMVLFKQALADSDSSKRG
jgi:uncharacterized membrane protein YvlD (DUF360 family)